MNAEEWEKIENSNDTYHISRQHNSVRIHCVYDSQGDIFIISHPREIKKLYEITQQILFDLSL